MTHRCYDTKHPRYADYGGRGIAVCNEWMDFETYYADTGDPPGPGMTLDRIDNEGPYAPGNCEWASKARQSQNRRYCHHLTFNGKTQTASEWAREIGVGQFTIIWRVKHGWPVERILSTDPKSYHNR